MYTNTYPVEGRLKDQDEIITNALDSALNLIHDDPIARKLLEKSSLTETQLETLLIHLLANGLATKSIKFEKKALFRKKHPVSKGAFNRSLNQAQNNVIASIYTIIFLGYAGILNSPSLRPYLEVSNQLAEYRDFLIQQHETLDQNAKELVKETLEMIEYKISELAKPKSISNRL